MLIKLTLTWPYIFTLPEFCIRGRSQITFTRFVFFWPPPSVYIFYGIKVYKKSIFMITYPPPLVNVVCERPLMWNVSMYVLNICVSEGIPVNYIYLSFFLEKSCQWNSRKTNLSNQGVGVCEVQKIWLVCTVGDTGIKITGQRSLSRLGS